MLLKGLKKFEFVLDVYLMAVLLKNFGVEEESVLNVYCIFHDQMQF